MLIFISWSGNASRAVAEILGTILQHMVRGASTFVSTHDIDAGDRWGARLSEELEKSHHAILCVTRDNQDAPWLNYEAGAVSKFVDGSRVIPYTLGFPPGELKNGPLTWFQGVQNDEAGTWSLVRSLNHSMSKPDDEGFVREDFDLWWPRLREKMSELVTEEQDAIEENLPNERELLLELRQDVRRLLDETKGQSRTNVTNMREAIRLIDLALRDQLTRLPNRTAFADRGAELFASNTPYIIALLDLDRFKMINDVYGHAKADELLVVVADAIKEGLPSADIVARFGGDEFTAMFRGTTTDTVVRSLTAFIAALPNHTEAAGFPAVTASCGVSSDRLEEVELKMRDADRALYSAKVDGRAQVRLVE